MVKDAGRRRWSPEMITATAAVIIGVSALFVSLYETHLGREHQKASVWPHLEGGYSWDGESFRVITGNSGLGPARIEGIRIRVEGEAVRDWQEFFRQAGIATQPYTTSQLSGRVLLPGDPMEVLVLRDPAMAAATQERWEVVSVEACYCSIFDECWVTDFQSLREEVRRCPTWGETAFRN
jgi:hypothetical protein